MKLLRHLAAASNFSGGAVAIGNFDGVHRGHARLIERLVRAARDCGGPAIVFTFDPHPVRLLRPDEAPPPITWTERKAELLAQLGVDVVLAYPTDEFLLRLSAEEFFAQIVRNGLSARRLVEGPNFRFGQNRIGDIDLLAKLCSAANSTLEVVEPVVVGNHIVSSSRVRRLLTDGDVDEASKLLTETYRVRGMVVHGAGRGAKIGFPTANLDAIDTIIPGLGVYAGSVWGLGQRRAAAIHIGPSPTFGDNQRKVEVHIPGWSEALYGQPLEVDFHSRVRDIHRFANTETLLAQLRTDIVAVISRFDKFAHGECP